MELRAFLGRFMDFLYANPYAVSSAKIVLREHLAPSPVYEKLNEDIFKKILDRMVDVVLCITNETDKRQAVLQFLSMAGEIIGFRIQREILVRHLKFTGFSSLEIEEIKTLVFKNIFRQLGVNP
ncbi:MAG: CerR family C-terminal domain-containing protein [Thermoguttaceae bacterium]